jgi:Fic family protein
LKTLTVNVSTSIPLTLSVRRDCSIPLSCIAFSLKIFGYRKRFVAAFAHLQVSIGSPDSTHQTARYSPPPPQDVPKLVDEWLDWWHQRHRELRGQEKGEVIAGLAELHHRFLSIHPFIDDNGGIARSITDQAARELLNQSIGPEFVEDPGAYYLALSEADNGRLTPLANRIAVALR